MQTNQYQTILFVFFSSFFVCYSVCPFFLLLFLLYFHQINLYPLLSHIAFPRLHHIFLRIFCFKFFHVCMCACVCVLFFTCVLNTGNFLILQFVYALSLSSHHKFFLSNYPHRPGPLHLRSCSLFMSVCLQTDP